MNNAAGSTTSREEEIAFRILEQVLGVSIFLADAGAGNNKPDGAWTYPGGERRRGIVEVTSPPDKKLMSRWAQAKRDGLSQSESGSIPPRIGELHQVCAELLAAAWALDNIAKLRAEPADERHLFLFGRSHRVQSYFCRLSDTYEDGSFESVLDLVLPDGITDLWCRGRARREEPWGTRVWVARFQAGVGWNRYVADIDERHLPSPNASLADDRLDPQLRAPRDRSI
ncbi:hypothetical protein [Tessaracoccus oleiagri]|uniref:hypothetical protein n=1 Tax=Tessaracoccus oleiagri TaxID=686624 RepID=UPI0011600751|nr:hypothetical protein [Tessaracoccus oleiagri]